MKSTPLQQVKDRFGDKEKLVAAVQALASDELWLDRVNDEKGLERVSNAKLLHLHDVLTAVKERFGSRSALIAEIVKLENRKDEGFRARLEAYPTPRLLDFHGAAKRRAKHREQAAARKPETKPAKKPRTRKAKAKARASAS